MPIFYYGKVLKRLNDTLQYISKAFGFGLLKLTLTPSAWLTQPLAALSLMLLSPAVESLTPVFLSRITPAARHGMALQHQRYDLSATGRREAEAADARFLTRAGAAPGTWGKVNVSIQHCGVVKQMTENLCNNNELLCFQQMNRRNKAINY